MLKKIILLLISVFIMLAPAGCSKKDKGQTVDNSDKQVVEKNESKDDENKNKEEVNNSEAEKKEEVKKEEEKNNNEASDQNQSNNKPGNIAKPEPPKQTKPDENNQSKPSNPGETHKPETPKEPEKPAKQEPSVKEISDKILKEVKFSHVVAMNEELSKEFYPFDRNLVSEYIIYNAMINVKSDEVAVFKVKDASNISEVEKGIQKRVDQLEKIWQSYLQDQYDKVKKHVILKKDNYILFSVSDDQKKVEEIFNSFFSK
ncbi:DUF4358 domain-containing protein [Desnuesiella massiliensis]|uniref:DUF4358 domain-containing protein n=1 Tax=Desnuesiella massiliensis TaxID=1650662 RepID=UPI0006E394D6|nr:DUF4358 domain-containing protein [Desnuesiella massiliensis]